jgi:Raf kinase inhibitor-like YbhB/YbcL family protein
MRRRPVLLRVVAVNSMAVSVMAGSVVAVSVLLGLAGCGFIDAGKSKDAPPPPIGSLSVTSPSFAGGAAIPEQFSCKGENVSPPLQWSGIPSDARSVALVVDDPDAPSGTFTHWVVFNIDPQQSSIGKDEVPKGARQAKNSAGHASYDGPCPPSGTHHYRFTVSVLRSPLTVPDGADTARVLSAIRSKTTARGGLTGTFAAS